MCGIGYLTKVFLSKFWQHRYEMNFCEWFREITSLKVFWLNKDMRRYSKDGWKPLISGKPNQKQWTYSCTLTLWFLNNHVQCSLFSINFPKVCIFGMLKSKIVIVDCIFSLQFWNLIWSEIGIVSYFQRVLNLAD